MEIPKGSMPPEKIRELLQVMRWKYRNLATAMRVSENLVARWLCTNQTHVRYPRFAESYLMQMWLDTANGIARHTRAPELKLDLPVKKRKRRAKSA